MGFFKTQKGTIRPADPTVLAVCPHCRKQVPVEALAQHVQMAHGERK